MYFPPYEKCSILKGVDSYYSSSTMPSYTVAHNRPLTPEDLVEAMDILKNLPPIATEIHVSQKGLEVLVKNIKVTKNDNQIGAFCGLTVYVVEDKDMKDNQGKLIYNDGHREVIDIY